MKDDSKTKADCFQCAYFAVTWEPKQPRACRLFGFKSAVMPSVTVYRTTGVKCMGFVKKDTQNKSQ